MPYKTKFRDIELPQNGDELIALGSDLFGDANSIRSFGARRLAEMRHVGA